MTLSECMGMGPLPTAEALRVAMNLGEALRRLHDEGRCHGSLTPDLIELQTGGLEIAPAPDAPEVTAYTAPEVADGQKPDARADIFAFAAIVFEITTGWRVFDGDSDTPSSSRNPELDRVLAPCLVKDPEARISRIPKVMLELKLLAVAARKNEAVGRLRRDRAENATRSEMKEMELRMEGRLAAQAEANEQALADLQQAANDATETFREQLSILCSELSATQERLAEATKVPIEVQLDALKERILARVHERTQALDEKADALRNTIEEMTRKSTQFEQRTAVELLDLDRGMKANTKAITAAQMNEAQSEDLMERVIEILESMQSDILETGKPADAEPAFAADVRIGQLTAP